ncbi:DUF4271 domain-containing protein [Pedobacter changchengzhani]|uniref:DUF4271 domain-containing protein n=1 Tax=Pedobacter changchengzhani TaxID=2529274 RepID=A0A4R5MQ46_9SPHI|nr:DUF4271 domain-containing protein [Pedobacter changchengzhani]TDG37838.1 DUF4271 domain-containing protein [Pedobacter changchengzhani]
MPKCVLFLLISLFVFAQSTLGQEPTVQVSPIGKADTAKAIYHSNYRRIDPVKLAMQQKVTDSIMAHSWVLPDSAINNHAFLDSVQNEYLFPVLDLYAWHKKYQHLKKKVNPFKLGTRLPKGNVGLLGFVLAMLVIFAILKNLFSKQLYTIVEAFFNNRILNNINKEDNLFSSWPFLLLFIQFGFVFGMFFFLVAQYNQMYQALQGFRFLFTVSISIIILYALKLIVLRFLGYVFNVQKAVGEYISILYLSYFNASLLFIPLIVAFALSPLKYGSIYIGLSVVLLGIIFTFQLIRAGINILSNNKFSKMHLILYFCALEICPILILIKTIGL